MSTFQTASILLIGLAAGILGGMFGLGGGVIIQPALVLLAGFSIKDAIGTSLAAVLLPFGLLGVIEYYKSGHINIPATLLLVAGLFIGCYFGAKATLSLPDIWVKKGFGILLLLVSVRYLTMK